MLVILIATLGPFVQQILSVNYRTFVIPGNASMPIAFNISNAFGAVGTSAPFASDAGLISSIYQVLAMSRVESYTVAPMCSTGNCTWTNFNTLAIASTVDDVSSQLEYVDKRALADWFRDSYTSNSTSDTLANASSATTTPQQILRLPNTGEDIQGVTAKSLISRAPLQSNVTDLTQQHNGTRYSQRVKLMQIQSYNPYRKAATAIGRNATAKNATDGSGATSQDTGLQVQDGEFLFFYIFYVSVEFNFTMTASGLQDVTAAYSDAAAWRCKFAAVLQPMSGRTENGFTSEDFTPSQAVTAVAGACNSTSKRCDLNYDFQGQRHRLNVEVLDRLANITAMPFTDAVAAQALYVRDDAGRVGSSPISEKAIAPTGPLERGGGVPIVYQIVRNMLNDTSVDDDAPFPNFTLSLDDFMANLARSQTSWLRTRSRSFVQGQVWRTAAVYSVQWAWISVPVAIFFAIATLVGYTGWRSRSEGLPSWTDSTLAVAIHGLDDNTRRDLVPLSSIEELRKATKGINVRLCKNSYTLVSDLDAYEKV